MTIKQSADRTYQQAVDRLHAAVALYTAANELVECLRDRHPVAA